MICKHATWKEPISGNILRNSHIKRNWVALGSIMNLVENLYKHADRTINEHRVTLVCMTDVMKYYIEFYSLKIPSYFRIYIYIYIYIYIFIQL